MRRILFSLIIIIALLGNINIADAQYAHPGTAIKTNDGNVQSDIIGIKSDIAQSTAEIIALRANDQTQEIFINDNFNNLQTHETEIADITNEISLILANLGTIEIRLDSIEANILSMIQPADAADVHR